MKKVPPGEAAHFLFGLRMTPKSPVFGKIMRRRTGLWKTLVVSSHLLPTYARVDLAFERGEGAWLFTADGERYLDFTSGVAVNALGHAHPHVVAALAAQAQKLLHVSNLFRIPEAERLAERLCAETFGD